MKIILGFVLFFVIITGIGFAHSQVELIPTWIKNVAGLWAEDKITDREFINALKFMIESDIIQVNNPKIEQLEKENKDLRQQIKSSEDKKTLQPVIENEIKTQTHDIEHEQYVKTDKKEYGLGDTIKVSGKTVVLDHTYGLDGKILSTFNFNIHLENTETGSNTNALSCNTYSYDDYFDHDGKYRFFNVGSRYINNYSDLNKELCNIDNNGIYSFDLIVNNDLSAGTFVILIYNSDHDNGISHKIKSEPFIIR